MKDLMYSVTNTQKADILAAALDKMLEAAAFVLANADSTPARMKDVLSDLRMSMRWPNCKVCGQPMDECEAWDSCQTSIRERTAKVMQIMSGGYYFGT